MRLENNLNGFIHTKNISDKEVKNPEDRVKFGMTLHARILKIDIERFQVDLTCKTSDLVDKDDKLRYRWLRIAVFSGLLLQVLMASLLFCLAHGTIHLCTCLMTLISI